jgi:hypothetical protein
MAVLHQIECHRAAHYAEPYEAELHFNPLGRSDKRVAGPRRFSENGTAQTADRKGTP